MFDRRQPLGMKEPLGESVARAHARACSTVERELDCELDVVSGRIPRDLDGVYFRNGPGRFEVGGESVEAEDADGLVARFAIRDGSVRYRNRYVETLAYLDEGSVGHRLYRGRATPLPGGPLSNALATYKNAANAGIAWDGRRVLALAEHGTPYALDPETLATLGVGDLGGALAPESWLARWTGRLGAFATHVRDDDGCGERWAVGMEGSRPTRVSFFRFDDEGRFLDKRMVSIAESVTVHDLSLTPHWAIAIASPIEIPTARVALGLASPMRASRTPDDRTKIAILVPRGGGAAIAAPLPPGRAGHHVNAFETAGGYIVLDVLVHTRTLAPDEQHVARVTIDPRACTATERPLGMLDLENATVSAACRGAAHRFVWALHRAASVGAPIRTSLVKLDLAEQTFIELALAPDLPSEPLFVGRRSVKSEDGGWLLSLVYRAAEHTTELWILDARSLVIVARARLPHHLPPATHGCWVPRMRGRASIHALVRGSRRGRLALCAK